MAKNKNKSAFDSSLEELDPLNCEQQKIIAWLKKVHFRKKLFGGVSERDLWRKLGELNEMYNIALTAERARYDALLAEEKARSSNCSAGDASDEGDGDKE